MTRGIFLVGNESTLFRAIEAETVKRIEKYTATFIPNRLFGVNKTSAPVNDKRELLDWNPSSPISARTVVLAAENRLERIDEAILICSPPSVRCSAAELSLADVEIMVNDHIKGWFFLVRELAAAFSRNLHGTLALVYHDISSTGRDDTVDIIGPSSLASFRALCQGLLSAAHGEPYTTIGFSCTDMGNEAAFAAYIFKSIDEINKRSNGKLYKYGKFSFFK